MGYAARGTTPGASASTPCHHCLVGWRKGPREAPSFAVSHAVWGMAVGGLCNWLLWCVIGSYYPPHEKRTNQFGSRIRAVAGCFRLSCTRRLGGEGGTGGVSPGGQDIYGIVTPSEGGGGKQPLQPHQTLPRVPPKTSRLCQPADALPQLPRPLLPANPCPLCLPLCPSPRLPCHHGGPNLLGPPCHCGLCWAPPPGAVVPAGTRGSQKAEVEQGHPPPLLPVHVGGRDPAGVPHSPCRREGGPRRRPCPRRRPLSRGVAGRRR